MKFKELLEQELSYEETSSAQLNELMKAYQEQQAFMKQNPALAQNQNWMAIQQKLNQLISGMKKSNGAALALYKQKQQQQQAQQQANSQQTAGTQTKLQANGAQPQPNANGVQQNVTQNAAQPRAANGSIQNVQKKVAGV